MASSAPDPKVLRIASLTLVNAMIFQQVLAAQDSRIESLNRTLEKRNVAESFSAAWTAILKIDYVPIFTTANNILRELVGVPDADSALKALAQAALRITSRRAALRHDLMGRIYHRLLADAKYFGAFYTTVPDITSQAGPGPLVRKNRLVGPRRYPPVANRRPRVRNGNAAEGCTSNDCRESRASTRRKRAATRPKRDSQDAR